MGRLTWVELEAHKQDLGHDQACGFKGLRGQHAQHAHHTQVDLPIGGDGGAHSYQQHSQYEALPRVLQPGHKQSYHCRDWSEGLHPSVASDSCPCRTCHWLVCFAIANFPNVLNVHSEERMHGVATTGKQTASHPLKSHKVNVAAFCKAWHAHYELYTYHDDNSHILVLPPVD